MKRIVLCMVLVSLFCCGMVWAAEDDPELGKVGDYVVKKSDVKRLISYHTPEKQRALQEDPEQARSVVKRMLEVKVISDRAKAEEFDERPEVKEQLQYLVNDFLSREYLKKVVMQDITVSDKEIQDFYALNEQNFKVPEQVRARHILIAFGPDAAEDAKKRAGEKAETVLKRLKAGEAFEKLVSEYSDDTESKAKGGDLGYFTRGQTVKPFEDAAFGLKPGSTSEIVETDYGYHVLKIEDHKEARARSFDEVKDTIRQQLERDMASIKVDEFIKKACEQAGMEIYTDKIVEKTQAEKSN